MAELNSGCLSWKGLQKQRTYQKDLQMLQLLNPQTIHCQGIGDKFYFLDRFSFFCACMVMCAHDVVLMLYLSSVSSCDASESPSIYLSVCWVLVNIISNKAVFLCVVRVYRKALVTSEICCLIVLDTPATHGV